MTWIKICGTTNLEDAQLAVAAGADALGFVFYEKSPRKIDPDAAREIVAKLASRVEKVGVFVDGSADHIREIAQRSRLTAVQLYGAKVIAEFVSRVANVGKSPKLIPACAADKLAEGGVFYSEEAKQAILALLLDAEAGVHPGGTGKTFDWNKAYRMVQALSLTVPVIVAGGLTPANVALAVRRFTPWGVDVASGVESKPGKKDPEKVRAFVEAVRGAEKII